MRSWLIASGFALSGLVAAGSVGGGCAGSEDVDKTSASGDVTGPGSGGAGGADATGGQGAVNQGGTGGEPCIPERKERCDGVDNTCDGEVDEGCDCVEGAQQPCFTGDTTLIGIGVCAEGTQTCDRSGIWGECAGEVLPSPEDCDLEDDDCDGAVDEDQGSITCGDGICQVTVEACIEGVDQECTPGEPNPLGETCDGTDDNCDGKIDEGCSCLNGQTQACYGGSPATQGIGECQDGTQTCTGGQWGSCDGDVTPVAEECDGLDNDCDGAQDENDPEGGSACNTGNLGICAAGVEHCTGGQLQCQQTNQLKPETCNGSDDDCDGATDEANPGGGGACDTGKAGVCAAGTMTCQGGALACVQNVQSSAETCDGVDNDCDGSTDEGNPGGGSSCNTGLLGVCGVGTLGCQGGQLVCTPNAQPSAETCNSSDDDCDGSTDEGNPGGGASCNTGKQGVCAAGTINCLGGQLSCTQTTQSSAETCDGVDNDCDGAIDENNPGGGGSCNTGLPGPCSPGALTCVGGAISCVGNVQPTVESCDSVDNDCNGVVDNGTNACGGACALPNMPSSGCDGADTDLCNEGMWQCSGLNAVVCSDSTGNNVETCNSIDDDCDGVVDEGSNGCGGVCTLLHTPSSPCDGPDTDACTEGTWQCSGKNLVTCSDTTGNNVEVCNSVDEDCDGNISEGPCSLANASSTCQSGACAITTCNAGYANCDSNASTGCELQNSGYSNSAPGEGLGTWDADAASGLFCGGDSCSFALTRTGTRGRYFTIKANEASTCDAYVALKFELVVPAGIDYDLFITGNACLADPGFSQTGSGNKVITVWCNDDWPGGANNGFTANVEVRYISGASCSPWTLNVYRKGC